MANLIYQMIIRPCSLNFNSSFLSEQYLSSRDISHGTCGRVVEKKFTDASGESAASIFGVNDKSGKQSASKAKTASGPTRK